MANRTKILSYIFLFIIATLFGIHFIDPSFAQQPPRGSSNEFQSPAASGNEFNASYGVSRRVIYDLRMNLKLKDEVIQNLLAIIGEKDVALKDRDDKLRELAKKYLELEDRLIKRPAKNRLVYEAIDKLAEGDLDGVDSILRESLDKNLTAIPEQRKTAAEDAFELGNLKEIQLEYFRAKNYYEQAARLDPNNSDYLIQLGIVLDGLGEYRKAVDNYKKALQINLEVFGEKHHKISTIYNNIGLAWNNLGEYHKATYFFEKALTIGRKVYGEQHPKVATFYVNLGLAWNNLGEFRKAIDYYGKALTIDQKIYGSQHPEIATDYNNLGGAWNGLGDYQKAIDYYEKALAIVQKVYGKQSVKAATLYNNIGLAWRNLGRYQKSIDYYEKALAIVQKLLGKLHPQIAVFYNNLGVAWKNIGEYHKAIDYYQKALAIVQKPLGDQHPQIAILYYNLGEAWNDMGEYQKAIDSFEKALTINRRAYGEEHPMVLILYNRVAESWNNMGEHQKAIDSFEKALTINRGVYGEQNLRVATLYNNIGLAWSSLGSSQKAIDYYGKALTINQEILGENNLKVAIQYNNLSRAYQDIGQPQKANEYHERAQTITQKNSGEQNPYTKVDQILESFDLGNIAFSSPRSMNLDGITLIELLLSLRKTVEMLREELRKKMSPLTPTHIEEEQIRVSNRMEAKLTGSGFQISAITPGIQAVGKSEETNWKWQIKAISEGIQDIHLTLTVILSIEGNDTPKAIGTFERKIDVTVSLPVKIGKFIKNNWGLFFAVVFVPLVVYAWKIRRRKRAQRIFEESLNSEPENDER